MQQVAPGLWRWTTPHPDWEAPKQEDDPADWPRDVGSVAYETTETLVLIDPLIANGDFAALDEAAEKSKGVAILTTLGFHRRSRDELAQRYAATTTPPDGVDAIEIHVRARRCTGFPNTVPSSPGTGYLGDRPPGLRLCPESWLRYLPGYTQDDLRAGLRPLLDLPVEMVLVSHGEPVLHDGRAELERALS